MEGRRHYFRSFLSKTALLRPLLLLVLASCAVNSIVFSTINMLLLFMPNDRLRSATRKEMALDFYEGGKDAYWCVRKRAASASGWLGLLACAPYRFGVCREGGSGETEGCTHHGNN